MDGKPIILKLDRDRALKWGQRAKLRLGSLAKRVAFDDLAHPDERGLYALAAFVWAALVDNAHPFDKPEDLAEFLETEAQQTAAYEAFIAAIRDAQKKMMPQTIT